MDGCRPVEVLRKESLAGLAPSAACRVLSHAYAAVVPITPLPYPPLPLSPNTPGDPHCCRHDMNNLQTECACLGVEGCA